MKIDVIAELVGTIFSVDVTAGAVVQVGDSIGVLESM